MFIHRDAVDLTNDFSSENAAGNFEHCLLNGPRLLQLIVRSGR